MKITDPLNILADIVFASANDVLAGLQTWEEHEAYLRQTFEEYASRGIKLPLDLTKEPDYDYKKNDRHLLPEPRQAPQKKTDPPAENIPGIRQGVLLGID